jgi:hypothetical protein
MFMSELFTAVQIREKILQLFDFLELGCRIVIFKICTVPEECLTGTLGNFGKRPTIDRSLYREGLGIIP